jgi:hypothetical protein
MKQLGTGELQSNKDSAGQPSPDELALLAFTTSFSQV